ncbi:hypothetical protein [Streptomyces marianii]|uniref:Uncharacterized protein n=1 Tax=Streptomyces marianii TaxID=1817406 RepID=A0A5R9E3E1_9ACTN|nr:hypothetical protein [Streptomyces marianii]TLQ42533.1 hypothetical protein FEF34_04360 [Streptomyces marianii]
MASAATTSTTTGTTTATTQTVPETKKGTVESVPGPKKGTPAPKITQLPSHVASETERAGTSEGAPAVQPKK